MLGEISAIASGAMDVGLLGGGSPFLAPQRNIGVIGGSGLLGAPTGLGASGLGSPGLPNVGGLPPPHVHAAPVGGLPPPPSTFGIAPGGGSMWGAFGSSPGNLGSGASGSADGQDGENAANKSWSIW